MADFKLAGNTSDDSKEDDNKIKSIFDDEAASKETSDIVAGNIGQKFLEGMAINSNITLEQKMSLKAMQAIIDSMADTAEEARINNPEVAPQANKVAGVADVLSSLIG